MNKIMNSLLILFLNAHKRTKYYLKIWNFHQIFIHNIVVIEHDIIFKIIWFFCAIHIFLKSLKSLIFFFSIL